MISILFCTALRFPTARFEIAAIPICDLGIKVHGSWLLQATKVHGTCIQFAGGLVTDTQGRGQIGRGGQDGTAIGFKDVGPGNLTGDLANGGLA